MPTQGTDHGALIDTIRSSPWQPTALRTVITYVLNHHYFLDLFETQIALEN
jgi:hypothetical protein